MCAEWFDTPCLLRQVIEYLNMKRTIAPLEATIIAISILLLQEMMTDFKDDLCTTGDSFLKFIDELRTFLMGVDIRWIPAPFRSHGRSFAFNSNHLLAVSLSL